MKKISRMLLLAVALLFVFSAMFFVPQAADFARAGDDSELGWQVFIKYLDGSVPTDITQDGVCSQRDLWFYVKGYNTNDSYEYCVTKSPKTTEQELNACTWTLINASGSTLYETLGGDDYIKCSYTVDTSDGGISTDYYYFRRVYQVVSGDSAGQNKAEYYAWKKDDVFSPYYWRITVNVNSGSENSFKSIEARYRAKGANVETPYDGSWTAEPVTFTVTTQIMQNNAVESGGETSYVYNDARERLSFSEDFNGYYQSKYTEIKNTGLYSDAEAKELAKTEAAKLANWQFFRNGSNEVTVSKSLNGIVMWFRVTDIAGEYPKFAYYSDGINGLDGEAYLIKIDPATPNFDVSALTYNVSSELIDYVSASWTSNSVLFRLNDTSRCISDITYEYSSNSAGFAEMGGNELEITVSTNPVLFRAKTEAGKVFEYSFRYVVNIDGVTPQILSEGYTIDPDGESSSDVCDKALSSSEQPMELNNTVSAVTVYDYANNKVTVKIYNRDAEGNPVVNASGATFYYQDARARNLYTNNWQKMTDYETSGNERFYRYTLSVGTDISVTRYVKFKIVSGAGLSSKELEVSVTAINSVFTFSLPDDYLIAQYNPDGWIADKATIRAIVSVDSADYPTTQYTFYYWTEELTGEGTTEAKIKAQAASSVGSPVEYYDEKNGEILWIYEFDLVASANSFFNIRAMNAAKKLSGDTRTTYDIIRIDVLEPTYTWEAYIYPTTGEISAEDLKDIEKIKGYADDGRMLKIADKDNPDAGWVNGSIYLVVAVDVGVSGINLKDMAYAKDSSGRPMYDTAGNLVWQEVSGVHTVDFHEANTAGSSFGKYYYFFSLNNNDATKAIAVNEYRYRIYTGSGISTDLSFSAKFDSTDFIRLKSVDVTSATGKNKNSWTVNAGSGVLSNGNFSVCEDISLAFASSLDATGVENHYSLFYYPFTADMIDMAGAVPTDSELLAFASRIAAEDNTSSIKKYVELTESTVSAYVSSDSQGTMYFAVYLKSKARNWQNVSNYSGYYVVCVDYDTLNITIQYRLDAISSLESGETDEDDMAAGTWKRGALEVFVTLPIDDKGTKVKAGDGYTYYYMLISFGSRGEVPDVNTILSTESNWILASGEYNGSDEYTFRIPFTDRSFYGYIGLSVCNKAKYRSVGFESVKLLRIDNTTPDIVKIIQGKTEAGLVEERTDETTNRKIVSVNTKDEITLSASAIHADLTHSAITYYYMRLPSIPTDPSEKKYATSSDMTLLDNSGVNVFSLVSNFSRENFCTVYLMIFAINAVATHSTGFSGSTAWETGLAGGYTVTLTTIYEFNYDPSELSSTALAPSSGSAEYNDNGMYEFSWQEVVGVSMTIKSNKRNSVPNYYRFMFSVDSGNTWYNYMEAGAVVYYTSDELKEIRFTAESLADYVDASGNHPFENGVMSTFMFRAVNKAGSYVDCGNIYINIDETIPEFDVVMHDHNGLIYIGGNTSDLLSGDANWTNGPVTVNVNITRMPASGVRVYYYLRYLNSNKAIESPLASSSEGKGKELVSYEQFTTDRLDGFNLNRDAVLVITAVSRSGASNIEPQVVEVRVSVDQQIPVFTLTGKAYEENDEGVASSVERIIASGEWTGMNTVSVLKERSVTNVSLVVFTYTWQDETMSEPESHVWGDNENSISRKKTGKLIVTATSANGDASKGRTYTVEFDINIDTTPPTIEFSGGINVIEGSEQYIDLQVVVHGDNLDIVEYVTVKEDSRGFTFDPTGYVLSTSSVDNSSRHENAELNPDINYRGYVRVLVRDKAGHTVEFALYVVPFPLTVNTIQLTDEDRTMVDELEHTLNLAKEAGYMEKSRIEYFENMISRLRDRMETLQTEIDGYRDYLEKLANRSSFELRSDYAEMLRYRTTFQNYEVYGQKWIQTAITGDSTSKYFAYYKNFLNQFDKLFALMEQVEKVETHVTELPAINMVEAEDYTEILRVYDEYFDLTQDQKSCFTSNLYNKLMDLKEACEVLLLSDKETGVVLDGDFAPGATIAVTTYDSNTDTYQNAQALLMNTVEKGSPRAIVSIHRVSLTGAYAQTAASDIVVDLPIPEDYRSYIYFAVYSLADDGSMRKINGSKIQPDGKSVQFSTNSLGTFVLCVTADIREQETQKDTYGSILGIPLTATMIKYILYIAAALFGLIFLVFIIMGIRQRRFMNSYNRAYRNSVYRRQARGVPKGNKFR